MSAVELGEVLIGFDDTPAATPDGAPDDTPDPLVLVHGHPFDRSMWLPQAEHVSAAGWRVIAADLRGYGQSGHPPGTVTPGVTLLSTFAEDIAALLDHLGVGRVVLGGLSMGGQIVMEFYRLFPERVSALVLADTTAEPETEEGRKQRNDMADRLLAEGMSGYANEVLPRMVAPANIEALPAVARHVLAMMTATSPEGAAAALRGRAERPDYLPVLRGVTVPTLVVVGREDEFTPVGTARFMHEQTPGSSLAVIEGAAHMPNLERTTEFNGALRHFLDGLR